MYNFKFLDKIIAIIQIKTTCLEITDIGLIEMGSHVTGFLKHVCKVRVP